MMTRMDNSRFLITGATGLIGSALVNYLPTCFSNVQMVLPVRNKTKAESMFADSANVIIVDCDLLTTDFEFAQDIDYIVHCASPTASAYFVAHPVETYNSVFLPSLHLLQYAARHEVKGFVYLSSLEVYGTILDDGSALPEEALGHVDLTSPRSSYPLAKRAVEHLCTLYAHQYQVPVTVARLTQTTGPGVSFEDNRVINAFCRAASQNEDIILYTTGESSRPYCHIDDAISAILLLLEKGVKGETYNVANESTFISAYNLALFIKEHLNPSINVKVELKKDVPYAPPTNIRMSTSKLQALGWMPQHSLEDICKDLFNHYRSLQTYAK